MACLLSLQTSHFRNLKKSQNKIFSSSNANIKDQNFVFVLQQGSLFKSCSKKIRMKCMITMADSDQFIAHENPFIGNEKMGFDRVDCLVWVLHESARSFSVAAQSLELSKSKPELAMAWVGVDVHAWHKNIAYKVAFYTLLKAAVEVEVFLSHKRCNNPSVRESLSPIIDFLSEKIESQLNTRNPKLVQWFRVAELPRVAGFFIPLFKKWSMEYAGSGIAGIIVAITCCAALRKLCTERISCPSYALKVEAALLELMSLSHSLVPIDKLHPLATEAGFEEEFLYHFGRKILPNSSMEDVEFWIGLVQKKLINAFHRENANSFRDKVQETSLATLGIFAYLGRETRLFISEMAIKDLDEQIKDFLSFLECGSLLIYPEFSTLAQYQLFIEVITDEIGWLDFYAAYACKFCDKRRSKPHAVQAETEIILYTILTVCYDVISGFAHYNNSLQQPLEPNLLGFLLHSQSLLSTCLEDFWAAYDRRGELQKIAERSPSDPASTLLRKGGASSPFALEAKQAPIDLVKREKHQCEATQPQVAASASEPLHEKLMRKSMTGIKTASANVWMGTQLLCIDVSDSFRLFIKQLKGNILTKRERKKIRQTLTDIVTLVPVTILMLLPVSAVGHAAMLAAIKRYTPSLIPSPYSSKRLAIVKQLKRTKKIDIKLRG